jgi:hypothetical protein
MSCCHFAILLQMARRFGVDCHCIAAYVDDKRTFRTEIASQAGFSIDLAKRALTATIYGPRASSNPVNC